MKRPTLNNAAIAVLLACVIAILLTVTAPAMGLTWDEPAYISSSVSYAAWFGVLIKQPTQAFSAATIDKYWSPTHEHPPFDRVWSGLIWSAARHVLDDLTAHRLGNILLVAFMVALLYLLVAESYGKVAGLFAAAALMSMPRFFFHSHLAALDVPVAVGIFAVTFFFWKTIERNEWWWGVLIGIAWGLAESIKLNATFLPIGLALWVLLFRRRWYVALRFALMGIGAVLTFVVVWPWLYHDLWARILAYADFHLHHFKIGAWYFGHYYVPPPWPFAFVMTWAVVPLTVMLLAFVGMGRARLGRQDKGLGWLLILSALVPLAVLASGQTLAYDNDRLFMPAYPFLAALAGAGFGWLLSGIKKAAGQGVRPGLAIPAALALGLALLAPQSAAMGGLYPHLLSYYSEGVGGLPGATRMKLESTYWCETYAAALPYINAHAKPGDKIWVEPWSYDVMIYYQMHGQLRPDVEILHNTIGAESLFGPTAPQPVYGEFYAANWLILEYRQSQFAEMGGSIPYLPQFLQQEADKPVYRVAYESIPIMELYER